jgi:hypothetical protein
MYGPSFRDPFAPLFSFILDPSRFSIRQTGSRIAKRICFSLPRLPSSSASSPDRLAEADLSSQSSLQDGSGFYEFLLCFVIFLYRCDPLPNQSGGEGFVPSPAGQNLASSCERVRRVANLSYSSMDLSIGYGFPPHALEV